MNYKLKWVFGGLPPIIMFICIDCVVYNQCIIHDASHSKMLEVLCVVGDSAGGPAFGIIIPYNIGRVQGKSGDLIALRTITFQTCCPSQISSCPTVLMIEILPVLFKN